MRVGIYIFDQVEILDFAGPYEVFSTAARVARRESVVSHDLFEVFTVARSSVPISARGSLSVNATYTLEQHPAIDLLIVPGGDVSAELERKEVIVWISQQAATATLTASICTGAFLLAKAGLLDGRAATTHWEDIEDMRRMFPRVDVQRAVRYVDEDKIVTSAGISAGIDMSLHLVARTAGEHVARRTARQMEYDWTG